MGQMEVYGRLLAERFGYPAFRNGQAAVLEKLSETDVLGVMPTGSGKSLCYVLPAIAHGRTLVVSPLIALMQDQVESLATAGVRAAFINSSLTRYQQNNTYLDFIGGRLDLLYVAPERFANEKFVAGLARHGVNLLAVDEAHCVSEWGHDFRPDYLTLGSVRQRLGSPRTLALTATADPRVRKDIIDRLGINGSTAQVVTSVDRPNLKFSVERISRDEERREWLRRYLSTRRGNSGIVYVRTRGGVGEIAAFLQDCGVRAAGYHAGMERDDRTRVQRQFTVDEVEVMVATNAFGMGVDKPDVRFVVHFNMPGRLESYYQEAGRAGRDGDPADCILLYGPREASAQQYFINKAHPKEDFVRATWQRWLAEQAQAQESVGPQFVVPRNEEDGLAATIVALRASGLMDSSSLKLASSDPEAPIDCASIAEHKKYVEERLSHMVAYAESHSCRRASILRYFGEPAPAKCDSCDVCRGGPAATPSLSRKAATPLPAGEEGRRKGRTALAKDSVGGDVADDDPLFQELRVWRRSRAERDGVAAFTVFSDRALRDIASRRPRTESELFRAWGVTVVKVSRYGDEVLAIVNAHA